MAVKLLAFAGALRTSSFNRKLAALAAEHGRALGAEVDLLDLRELAIPVYDGDLEASGLPDGVKALRERIAAAQALVIACPEHNASMSGALKNAIDWASRPPTQPFRGKVVGLVGATPGPFAVQRALPELRKVMASLGCHVVPAQLGIGRAGEVFSEQGRLRDHGLDESLKGVVRDTLDLAARMS